MISFVEANVLSALLINSFFYYRWMHDRLLCRPNLQKGSGYDQEKQQSHTADQPAARVHREEEPQNIYSITASVKQ